MQSCPLCGEIHPPRIHSYPDRCWRDPESGTNKKCKVIVIICKKSLEIGKQYTMRILPDFLLPYGVVRSDKVLEVLSEETDPPDLERVCSILGCIDFRTARKYLHLGGVAVERSSVSLAERLSCFHEKLSCFHFTPEIQSLTFFRSLIDRYNRLQIHIHGGAGYALQCQDSTFLSSHWPKKKPTTCVSDSRLSPDTS